MRFTVYILYATSYINAHHFLDSEIIILNFRDSYEESIDYIYIYERAFDNLSIEIIARRGIYT